MSFIHKRDIIIGVDLKFSLGTIEIWDLKVTLDPLSNFFIHHFEQSGLVDIEPPKLNPTWRNRWVGEDKFAKRLERFLVGEGLVSDMVEIR